MDVNTLRIITTVLGFIAFLLIVAWAYSKHSRNRFEEAAQVPFEDEDLPSKEGMNTSLRHGAKTNE